MVESNFVDSSFPLGWTMKERIRDNGKRDKFYYAPKNGPTFNSRLAVYRYLHKSNGKKKKKRNDNKRGLNRPWKIVSVEKSIAENLPSGWTREIRVKQKDQTIRREQYYTNPVTKTKFRSLQAIYRHLAIDIASVSADGHSVASRTRGRIDRSDMDAIILDDSQTSEQNDDLPRSESDKRQMGLHKSERTKAIVSPRRSKRLAGIDVDPTGLLPKTRPRRGVEPWESNESPRQHSSCSNAMECFPDNAVAAVIGCNEKHETVSKSCDLPIGEFLSDPCIAFAIKTLTGLTFEDLTTSSDRATSLFEKVKSEEDDKFEMKHVQSDTTEFTETPSFVGPWDDPCIEFAIKTLTDTTQLDYTAQPSQHHRPSFPKTRTNTEKKDNE